MAEGTATPAEYVFEVID